MFSHGGSKTSSNFLPMPRSHRQFSEKEVNPTAFYHRQNIELPAYYTRSGESKSRARRKKRTKQETAKKRFRARRRKTAGRDVYSDVHERSAVLLKHSYKPFIDSLKPGIPPRLISPIYAAKSRPKANPRSAKTLSTIKWLAIVIY